MSNTKRSNFKIDDAIIRRWNNRLYYICHDVDNDKFEFLIDKVKGQKVSKCETCEYLEICGWQQLKRLILDMLRSFDND